MSEFNQSKYHSDYINRILIDVVRRTCSDEGFIIASVSKHDISSFSNVIAYTQSSRDYNWGKNLNSSESIDLVDKELFHSLLDPKNETIVKYSPPRELLSSSVIDVQSITNLVIIPIALDEYMVGYLCLSRAKNGFTVTELDEFKKEIFALAGIINSLHLLREMESKNYQLNKMETSIADGVIDMNESGLISYVNPAIKSIYGYTAEELVGQPVTILMPEKYRAPHKAGYERYQASGGGRIVNSSVDLEGLHKDGSAFDLQMTIYEVWHGDNRTFRGVISDPAKKKAEKLYINSKQEQATLYRFAPVPIFVLDCEGEIASWNIAMENLTGFLESELVGKSLLGLPIISPEDMGKVAREIVLSSHDAAQETNEFHFHKKDSSKAEIHNKDARLMSMTWAKVTGPQGEFDGSVWIGQDITLTRQRELELLQGHKLMAFGEIASEMAHDFRNILQVVQGNVESVLDELDENQSDYIDPLKDVLEAATQGNTITKQLLDFSKKKSVTYSLIDTNKFIDSQKGILKHAFGDQISLHMFLQDDLPKIRIAEGRLSTALLNICINARDAIGGVGEVKIVSKLQTRNLKQYLMISVEDSGPGMDTDVLEKIAEPFFTTKTSGTGLGLAMVKNFVDESKGILEFDSEENMGLKVSMFFPLPAIRKNDPPSKHNEQKSANHVLIVEEDPTVLKRGAGNFRKLGFTVSKASNVQEAMGTLEADDTITLLFADVRLPGLLNGNDLAVWASNHFPWVSVVKTSGYDVEDSDKSGFPVLIKPYTQDALKTVLEVEFGLKFDRL